MKKIRHVAGAAGVAPLALGVMVPNAGPAQTHTAAPKANGKTVSLGHVETSRFGCTGTHRTVKSNPSLYMSYYFTVSSAGENTCVGTVFGERLIGFADWTMKVSASYSNFHGVVGRCAQNSENPCYVGLHSWFPHLHHVCTSWYNPAGTLKAKICRDPIG
jgi:hypothetical protein